MHTCLAYQLTAQGPGSSPQEGLPEGLPEETSSHLGKSCLEKSIPESSILVSSYLEHEHQILGTVTLSDWQSSLSVRYFVSNVCRSYPLSSKPDFLIQQDPDITTLHIIFEID